MPDDPETVEQAQANPGVLGGKTLKQVADHTTEIIAALEAKRSLRGRRWTDPDTQPPAWRPPALVTSSQPTSTPGGAAR